jgi:hypothetical protein
MRKYLFGAILLILGVGIGVGAAYGFNKVLQPLPVSAAAPVNVNAPAAALQQSPTPVPTTTIPQQTPDANLPNQGWSNNGWRMGPGMMDDWGWNGNATPGQQNWNMGPGMMGRGMMGDRYGYSGQGCCGMGYGMMGGWSGNVPTGQRITIDQALDASKKYIAGYGQDLAAAEIMEFNNNFYVSVKETATGRGAFELLVDPYSGSVYPEMGPNMMWNVKYGHMGNGQAVENTITMDQAIQQGQKYLDANIAGAKLQMDGTSFYGYYTFDFKVNDQVAGMLSVNGFDGGVWLHTWHGQFVAELEAQ